MKQPSKVSLDTILKLGDPRLYKKSEPATKDELPVLLPVIDHLQALILAFREKYGTGRAIAAPQIGVKKRIICMNTGSPEVFINPVLTDLSDEMMELWDDCMCFPHLLVRVRRHRRCTLHYVDLAWRPHAQRLEDDLSELLQHEYDHLEGILATQRAIDLKSFRWK
jgi:peptide deformylase